MAKKKRYYNSKMKKKDSMIQENYSAHANLPKEVIMRDYPMVDYGSNREYDDTRADIDSQMMNDSRALRNHPAKKRY